MLVSNDNETTLTQVLAQPTAQFYIQQDGWVTPAYFAPSQFNKNATSKDEIVFSAKEHTFSASHFLNFPTFEVFRLFAGKPHNEGGEEVLKR